MHTEKVDAQDSIGASAILGGSLNEQVSVTGHYFVRCFDANNTLKWEDTIENTVVTVGKANLLNVYLASSTQTTLWYLGLVDSTPTPSYNVGDTMLSHAGWAESVAYANANRPQAVFGTPTATSSISSTAASFTMNASITIAGAFLTTSNAKSGTAGTLYSAGNFAVARAVISGDTLLVTYTATV
jgi:hypothetical protein